MNEWEKELIERLRKVFAADTQQQIADKINTTQGNVSKILNGKQSLTLENIYLISKAYGVSVDWLLGVNRPMNNESVIECSSYSKITNSLLEVIHKGGDYTEEKLVKAIITINDPILTKLLKKGVALSNADKKYYVAWKENDLPRSDETELLYSSIITDDFNLLYLVELFQWQELWTLIQLVLNSLLCIKMHHI